MAMAVKKAGIYGSISSMGATSILIGIYFRMRVPLLQIAIPIVPNHRIMVGVITTMATQQNGFLTGSPHTLAHQLTMQSFKHTVEASNILLMKIIPGKI